MASQLNIADYEGNSPLHMACERNSAAVLPLFCGDPRCTPILLNST